MFKNILLDLDDTLLDFHKAERVAITKTLVHIGIEPKDEILTRYSQLNLAQWKLLEQGKLTRTEVRLRRYLLLFNELGIKYSAEKAAEYYENQLGVGHYFIDGAETLLQALSNIYRLYMVSNGTASVQKSRIESAGIAKYFENIFISQLVGFDKPRVEFFEYCFSEIPSFRKEETMIVGDSLSSDIKGGKNAGITTVWFNPHKYANTSELIPDYEINSLWELVTLLEAF